MHFLYRTINYELRRHFFKVGITTRTIEERYREDGHKYSGVTVILESESDILTCMLQEGYCLTKWNSFNNGHSSECVDIPEDIKCNLEFNRYIPIKWRDSR